MAHQFRVSSSLAPSPSRRRRRRRRCQSSSSCSPGRESTTAILLCFLFAVLGRSTCVGSSSSSSSYTVHIHDDEYAPEDVCSRLLSRRKAAVRFFSRLPDEDLVDLVGHYDRDRDADDDGSRLKEDGCPDADVAARPRIVLGDCCAIRRHDESPSSSSSSSSCRYRVLACCREDDDDVDGIRDCGWPRKVHGRGMGCAFTPDIGDIGDVDDGDIGDDHDDCDYDTMNEDYDNWDPSVRLGMCTESGLANMAAQIRHALIQGACCETTTTTTTEDEDEDEDEDGDVSRQERKDDQDGHDQDEESDAATSTSSSLHDDDENRSSSKSEKKEKGVDWWNVSRSIGLCFVFLFLHYAIIGRCLGGAKGDVIRRSSDDQTVASDFSSDKGEDDDDDDDDGHDVGSLDDVNLDVEDGVRASAATTVAPGQHGDAA